MNTILVPKRNLLDSSIEFDVSGNANGKRLYAPFSWFVGRTSRKILAK